MRTPHEVVVEISFDANECSLSEVIYRSLVPEVKLKLRDVEFEVMCGGCEVRLVMRGHEIGSLTPPVVNSLSLISMLIEVVRTLTS